MSKPRFIVKYPADFTPEEHVHFDTFSDPFYNEWQAVLIDVKTNTIVFEDGGEPEDMTLTRNLYHLVRLLNKVASGE